MALKHSGVTHFYIFTCDWRRGLGPPHVENFATYRLQPPGSRLCCDFKDVVFNILQKSQFYIQVEMLTCELHSSVCYWLLLTCEMCFFPHFCRVKIIVNLNLTVSRVNWIFQQAICGNSYRLGSPRKKEQMIISTNIRGLHMFV